LYQDLILPLALDTLHIYNHSRLTGHQIGDHYNAMSRSQDLYNLQLIDTEIDQGLHRLDEIGEILDDESGLDLAQSLVRKHQEVTDQKSRILKKAEDEVAAHNQKIKSNQNKLYGGSITNPKELQDLQMESAALDRFLATLEERQLEAMLEMDDASRQLQEAKDQLNAVQIAREDLVESLKNEQSELQQRIETLNTRRTDLSGIPPDDDLKLYQKLRASLGGIAVVKLENSSCGGCGSNLPSALEQKAKSPSSITQCLTCKRILYPG
jgi:predicted  nucleic acid-binding Zn-ribbon protein